MFGRLFGKKKEEKTEDDVKLEQSLTKTRSGIFGRIGTIFQENEITDELWEELEETLIMGDVGMATAEYAIATLAACGFAGLLVAILSGGQVRGLLLGIIRRALSVG